MNSIGFYCEHAFSLYDIYPIVEKYRGKSKIYIITRKKYLYQVETYIKPDKVIFIEDYANKYVSLINKWFFLFCVRSDFSEFYFQRRKLRFSKKDLFISRILFFLKLKNESINKKYNSFFNFFFNIGLYRSFGLNFEKLYVFTKAFNQYLLAPYSDKISLIIESWDHPAKEPFMIFPKIAYGWNEDLKNELKQYQNYQFVSTMCPLKFRYIFEFDAIDDSILYKRLSSKYQKDLALIDAKATFVYPMCTSSRYFAFEGELTFVKTLADLLNQNDLELYIRPYPLAPKNDAERLSQIQNVKVGVANNHLDGKEVFEESHLLHKYFLIKKSFAVINVGTTFAFDAALLEKRIRILQLIIDKKEYGDFDNYSKGIHIQKYLHNEFAVNFSTIENNSSILHNTAYDFRNIIRKWVLNKNLK